MYIQCHTIEGCLDKFSSCDKDYCKGMYFYQGYSCRTCVWDGDSLVLPSDSGKLVWWSQTGNKLASFAVGTSDYVVRLEWSVLGRALWMCGFSTMICLEVKRSNEG